MKYFVICPVRNITPKEKKSIDNYILSLENLGHKVYLPYHDTDQNDDIGLRICSDNFKAIKEADKVLVFWNGKSEGSLFDFGMSFAFNRLFGKPIELINSVKKTPYKSFNNVLLALQK